MKTFLVSQYVTFLKSNMRAKFLQAIECLISMQFKDCSCICILYCYQMFLCLEVAQKSFRGNLPPLNNNI